MGRGSFASFPPPEAGARVDTFERLSRLDVMPGENRPIPTNDWWSHLLVSPFGGDLWVHPLVVDPDTQGVRLWYPTEAALDGNGMSRGEPIEISGTGFAPTRDVAKDWGDWHVVVRLEDGAKHMDMTLARGVPVAWFEVSGFQPAIKLPAGGLAFTATGAAISTTQVDLDKLVIVLGAKSFGVHLPAGSKASLAAGVVSLSLPANKGWLAISGLPSRNDLAQWQAWATVVPRSTKIAWAPTGIGRLGVTYTVTGQDLSGSGQSSVLQTFPAHTWRDAKSAPAWRAETWLSPRGRLKAALGSSFAFVYDMPGIIPDYGVPGQDQPGEATPWRRSTQDSLVSSYLSRARYGEDTYWGGKDLVLMAKHAIFARQTNHPDAAAMQAKAREAMIDWLTWTPGEKAHYFAWYPRWKALIGFQESYGSSEFVDNHFHYGYLIHAAGLLGSIDPQFLADYGPMLKRIAQQYANWDRKDTTLPFLRTFEPWTGHSYAGGTSSPGGNNQESTSEAMQSWIGLFVLGSAMGDTAMRNAGSFGYLMESRATMEYWFDWKKENFAPGWKHSMVGILFDGGQVYGTWFSGNPLHIHGIQYLPICPGFNYLARDTTWARGEYKALMDGVLAADEKWTDESQFGDDWANVAFGFKQLFDPKEVCRRWEVDRAATGWTNEINAGITYNYAHANRQLGSVDWALAYSLPTAVGFRKGSKTTHVIWNPEDREVECVIYRNGVREGAVKVPPRTTVRHSNDATATRLEISGAAPTLVTGKATQLALKGYDQYGASIELGSATWTASSGTITASGLYTPAGNAEGVRIEAKVSGLTAFVIVRTGVAPRLSGIQIRPAYVQVLSGGDQELAVRGKDQYGDPILMTGLNWTTRGPITVANGKLEATGAGQGWAIATSGSVRDSIPVDVYAQLLDLSSNAKATASSTIAGFNTPEKVLDGDRKTRWESEHGIDSVWFQLELDTIREIKKVVLDWEGAAASKYEILVSDDARTWRTYTRVAVGDGGLDSIASTGYGRFVRIRNSARTTGYGYSLLEVRVAGFPRTAYSARLENDTTSWGGPTTEAGARVVRNGLQKVRVGSMVFQIALQDGETVQSAQIVDLRGRPLQEVSSSIMAVLRVKTNLGWRSSRVVVPGR